YSRHSGMRLRSAIADLRRQARNPYSRSWLWIPGSSFGRPGITWNWLATLRHDLLQQHHQRFRRRHIRRMAGVDLVIIPARLALGALGKWTKSVRGRDARGVNIAARQSQLAAVQLQRRQKTFDRHVDAALGQPFEIVLWRIRRRWIRRHAPAATGPCQVLHPR